MLAGLNSGCATIATVPMSAEERLDRAQEIVTKWYAYSEVVALKLMDKYGPPDRLETNRLVWHNAGPWGRIAVWDEEDYDYSGRVGRDNLEQTLISDVPRDKRQALAAFSSKITVSQDGKELSVRGTSEALDFLAINLAHEIVRGSRSPAQARLFYDRTCQLSQAGKSSPYMQEVLFIHRPDDTSSQ
jgi:hypothetical protein